MRQDLARDPDWGWPGIECRHHRGGILKPVLIIGTVVSAFGYAYERGYEATTHGAAPVKVVTRTVTRTVVAHPALSGTDVVLIFLIIAVMVVGGLSVARHLR
jgi:hypothetical protein